MVASKEQRPLRNAHVVANHHLVEVINPARLAKPTVVTNDEVPWRFDDNIILDHQPLTNLSPKRNVIKSTK